MWNLRPLDRIFHWKDFREGLRFLTLEECLVEVSHLWSFAPFVNYYLDPESCAKWPDPWTLLHENYYCDLAKTLGMFYTIALSEHGKNKIVLSILEHKKKKEQINIVIVNDTHILNYDFNSVVNSKKVSKNYHCSFSYTVSDLNIQSYQ